MTVVVGVVLLIACAALAVFKSNVEAQQRRVFGVQRLRTPPPAEDGDGAGSGDGGHN